MFLAMGNDDDADDGHVVKGRVKFLSAVYFFPENNAVSYIFCKFTHT